MFIHRTFARSAFRHPRRSRVPQLSILRWVHRAKARPRFSASGLGSLGWATRFPGERTWLAGVGDRSRPSTLRDALPRDPAQLQRRHPPRIPIPALQQVRQIVVHIQLRPRHADPPPKAESPRAVPPSLAQAPAGTRAESPVGPSAHRSTITSARPPRYSADATRARPPTPSPRQGRRRSPHRSSGR